MNIRDVGLSTSAFGYSMGSVGKHTDRKNPKPWTLEEFVEFAAAHGFGGVEVPIMRFIPDLNRSRIEALKALLREQEMFFIMDSESALDKEQITTLIPLCKEFRSPVLRIKSSNILGCDRKKLGMPWQEHVKRCIAVITELAPLLRKSGITIAIENHQDLDSNDLLQIIESVGPDVAGVTFDIGNAFSTCEDPSIFAEKLGSYIRNVHLKDYTIGRTNDGFRLVRCSLGKGAVDFKAVIALLKKRSPNARMVVELGALEARVVASSSKDFWNEVRPRTSAEVAAFSRQFARHAADVFEDSWKTPWERGTAAQDVTAYEIEELKASIAYLNSL